jgi:hypothetical protein
MVQATTPFDQARNWFATLNDVPKKGALAARAIFRFFAILCLCVGVVTPVQAGGLGEALGKLGIKNPFKDSDEALTTNIRDAQGEIPLLDDFTPLRHRNVFVHQSADGQFLLPPGAYIGVYPSFCLHAGTYAPTQGAGYVPAALKGPKAKLISRLLAGAGRHPEIPQHEVQSLIWTIESRAKLSSKMEITALRLLAKSNGLPDPKDLLELRGGIQSFLPTDKINNLVGKASKALRPIIQARNVIRQLAETDGSFEQMAMVAVLQGEPPASEQVRVVPSSRWTYLPSGLFVRYRPSGYSQTQIETYCPEPFTVRSDERGRIREIETADQAYKLVTVYEDDAAAGQSLQMPLGQSHRIATLTLTQNNQALLRLSLRGVTVATGASTPDTAAPLQEMQAQFIKGRPRTLTGLVVNFTNYRDSLAKALTKLPDANSRNLLNDFVARAWIATAYQWINESTNGVRTSRVFRNPETSRAQANGQASIIRVQLPLVVPLIEFLVGRGAVTAATRAVGLALGWSAYELAICPGNTAAQRLGICPRPLPGINPNQDDNEAQPPAIPFPTVNSAPVASPNPDPDDPDDEDRIKVSRERLEHVRDRHTSGGSQSHKNKSIFNDGEDLVRLIRDAEKTQRTPQENGNFRREVNAGRPIGIDRATGQPTSIYTVITNAADELVTMFPGR